MCLVWYTRDTHVYICIELYWYMSKNRQDLLYVLSRRDIGFRHRTLKEKFQSFLFTPIVLNMGRYDALRFNAVFNCRRGLIALTFMQLFVSLATTSNEETSPQDFLAILKRSLPNIGKPWVSFYYMKHVYDVFCQYTSIHIHSQTLTHTHTYIHI